MFKYNCYTDEHTAGEVINNIKDAIASMQHAIDSGCKIDGQKAVRDRRFTIHELQSCGIDRLSDFTMYEVAGIEFKVYGTSCQQIVNLPQFDLGGYPWEGDVVFKDYGKKHDVRALLLVVQYICERDGINPTDYVENVLGWGNKETAHDRKAA